MFQPPPADFGRKRRDVDGLEEYDDLVEAGRGFDGGCSNSCRGCNNTCGCDGDFTGRSFGFRYRINGHHMPKYHVNTMTQAFFFSRKFLWILILYYWLLFLFLYFLCIVLCIVYCVFFHTKVFSCVNCFVMKMLVIFIVSLYAPFLRYKFKFNF